ncbi:MAG: TusE/DsrC/DsvC family sulfur relay protein [Methylococcales bacterium]|jgi:tRNA 2-thiouridine synthesizing protein E|nr:TusE/DsrC/DsvC family sulfur relay protein [Methylococcales bacterium]MBT7444111.1 TusE/DsrC/DsvC family sulfur relay protein [Methylococcales bacterium]
MAIEVNGTTIEVGANGYLTNHEDWNEDVGKIIAAEEGIELTDKHWDLINFLRSEYINDGTTPNTRNITKAMKKIWGSADSKSLYMLFPKDPSKQGGRIAGLPESKRKGGY